MLTIPGVAMLRAPGVTVVECACGAGLLKLQPGESVYPVSASFRAKGQTTKRQVGCDQCGEKSMISVTVCPGPPT